VSQPTESPNLLLADVPIQRDAQDRLGRASFAASLAQSILKMAGEESFVFALCGPWGSGKSSVLELVLRHFEPVDDRAKPIVFRFNPWWYSGQDQLLQAFLMQFGGLLGRVDTAGRTKKLSERVATLGKLLRPVGWIPGAGVFKDAAEAIESIGTATKELAERLQEDIHAIRAEVDALLRQLGRRVVIVMDDIDRLTPHEITQLFLIVKAVADFPNTVYLLAFDQEVVAEAIGDKLGVDGTEYLKKIVQIQLELPSASPIDVQQLFLEQLNALIPPGEVNDSTRTAFGNLFHDGIKHYLNTPRDVKRLVNVLRVIFPALAGEVYWPDFVGVATLMVFAPSVHRIICQSPERFTGSVGFRAFDRREERPFHDAWLGSVFEKDREAVEEIVKRLFPKFIAAMGGSSFGPDWDSRWRADSRVCSPDRFERYFRLSIPAGAMSETEFRELVGLLENSTEFDRRAILLCTEAGPHGHSSRAKEFLERANDFAKHQATKAQASLLFRALFRVGDAYLAAKDEEPVSLITISNDQRLSWALQAAFDRIEDQKARDEFVEAAFTEIYAIHTVSQFLWLLGREHGRFGPDKDDSGLPPRVSVECLDQLTEIVLARIKSDAESGALITHPNSILIGRDWRLFGGEEDARKWVNDVSQDDRHLLGILNQLRSDIRSHSASDRVARTRPFIDGRYLLTYFQASDIRSRCNRILSQPPDWLTDHDKVTLALVLDSVLEDGTVRDAFLRTPVAPTVHESQEEREEEEE
jgi:predicted KAP-like P-loop ATPase